MDNNDDILDNVKKKTFTVNLYDRHTKDIKKILHFLSGISKNVYNVTVYIYSLFLKYKEAIFRIIIEDLNQGAFYKNSDIDNRIEELLTFFYNLYSKKDSNIRKNNDVLYAKIKDKLKNKHLINSNYNSIRNELIVENKNTIAHENVYEFEFIIDYILKSIYTRNFNKIAYEIKNNIPCFIDDKDFIENVKNKENLFDDKKSSKKYIEDYFLINLYSDQNIVTRFIYKNLGENIKKMPSDLIINIIKKAFGNFSSYWALKNKGIRCNMPKFLDKDDLFILPYFCRSFLIKNGGVRLTVGKYIAKNFIEIIGNNNLVCLNKDELTEYKKYVDKKFLLKALPRQKIKKLDNYIIKINGDNVMYISKKDINIIDAYYVNVKLPEKISKIYDDIKLMEIIPLYKGHLYRLNITYDVHDNVQFNNTKNEEEKKTLRKKFKEQLQEKKNENKESKDLKKSNKEKTLDEINIEINAKIKEKQILEHNESISIDFGMRNLITIYNPTGKQHIIKGNYLVSMNCYYNSQIDECKSIISTINNMIKKNENNDEQIKEIIKKSRYVIKERTIELLLMETLNEKINNDDKNEFIREIMGLIDNLRIKYEMRRKNKINNYFDKIVKYLYLNYGEKKSIICGYNLNWKKGINIGKKNNRNFYNIPFARLVDKLKNKFGEKIIMTEESYTSKCDALSLERIGYKENYLGVREKRGLYISNLGVKINADLNGAINIMRKKINLVEIKGENLFNPIVIKIITPKRVKLSCDVQKNQKKKNQQVKAK